LVVNAARWGPSKKQLGLVLDEEDSAPWTSGNRKTLRKTADIVAPSKDLDALEHGLMLEQLV